MAESEKVLAPDRLTVCRFLIFTQVVAYEKLFTSWLGLCSGSAPRTPGLSPLFIRGSTPDRVFAGTPDTLRG